MLDAAELAFGRYNGGQNAPIGSYWNPRTMAVFQQTADGVLPQSGTWIPITTSGSSSMNQVAAALNTVLNTSYTGRACIPIPAPI
ncbi:hypothetical protein EPA93_09220 [Ktedonosporobacter rubrisoli]|uniref:Uncharacterized protein n=1 Tax=Ktedonosporobacter rubrisoli TaxID=2509675 RepID=A0A4P6JLR8_KTERU|nr:hypothetical protein [Ktedonosporobacter rubrisoli]QBD76179.1 hypothetical protein EPA93_09220 [Ktedonosporobacter rubrisoli]